MELGLGVLGWPPPYFWQATPKELYAALDGYMEANQGGSRSESEPEEDQRQSNWPTRAEMQYLVDKFGAPTKQKRSRKPKQ